MFKCRIMLALVHLLAHNILFSCIGSKITLQRERNALSCSVKGRSRNVTMAVLIIGYDVRLTALKVWPVPSP